MRPYVPWMTRSDDVILEFLDEKAIAAPPLVIAFNTDISHPTVQRRSKELRENGLLHRYEEPRGYLKITEKGRKYLRGDLEADDLL